MHKRIVAKSHGGTRFGVSLALALLATAVALGVPGSVVRADQDEVEIALSLAKLLQSGRAVISANQDLINDPTKGDKGLSGDVVLAEAIQNYKQETGVDPREVDPNSRLGRLLRAEMAVIKQVVDENQSFMNQEGVGFKGFIPAVFARLVTERLGERIGEELEIKVTAPPALVRNRKSRPDAWERKIIETKFLSDEWKTGEIFFQREPNRGQDAFRVMVPEYYSESCLACHGEPKGEMDITGYPKEGASEGDLGGVISITLYQPGE